VILLAAALAAPLPAADRLRVPAIQLDTRPIVVLAPEPGSGLVTAQWVFDQGANDDALHEAGAAHLVEHLAFGDLAGGDGDYDERLGHLGGLSEGWTDRERAGLGATIPAAGADSAAALLELELSRMRTLVVTDDTMARQRAVIAEELAETHDAAHGLDRVWLSRLLWSAGEPWSRHPASPPAESIAVEAAEARWRRLVEGGVLVLAGDFEAGALRERVEAQLPAGGARLWRQGAALGEPGCEPAAPATSWTRGNGRRGSVLVAWPVPGRGHRDRVALEAIARWAGGARLAVGAGCGEWSFERTDSWLALPGHRASLLRALASVAEQGLDPASLARVRADAVADYARALSSLPLRARVVAGCTLGGRPPDCAAEEVQAWLDLRAEDLAAAATRWLPPDGATTLAVMPPDTRFAPWIPGIREWSAP
jgi:hypothetical protein